MGKCLTSNLAAAVVLGMSATTFAANPFSDVPAGHWAYNSIEKLAAEGIIEGYGDGTYRGSRNITRYEMAQMIARALARYENVPVATKSTPDREIAPSHVDAPTISIASRVELDRLAMEFHDELNDLGVRVAELEKHADRFQWSGKLEVSFANLRLGLGDGQKVHDISRAYTVYLDPEIQLNEKWTAMAEFQIDGDLTDDSTEKTEMTTMFVLGNLGDLSVALGKVPIYTNENGLVFDADMSGGALFYGDELYVSLWGGRMNKEALGGGIQGESDSTDYNGDLFGVNVQYDPESEHGLYGGVGYYYIKDKDFMTRNYSRDGNTDTAHIWSVNASYGFTDKLSFSSGFAQNIKADYEKDAWQTQLDYGKYDGGYATTKGDWSLFAGYRKLGTNVYFSDSYDDVMRGMQGWFVGANYAPFNNIGLTYLYFKGRYITGKGKDEKIFGQITLFF